MTSVMVYLCVSRLIVSNFDQLGESNRKIWFSDLGFCAFLALALIQPIACLSVGIFKLKICRQLIHLYIENALNEEHDIVEEGVDKFKSGTDLSYYSFKDSDSAEAHLPVFIEHDSRCADEQQSNAVFYIGKRLILV